MKTYGAKNKPKYIRVKLEDLNRVFQLSAEIEISVAYSMFFPNAVVPVKDEDNGAESQKIAPIEFTVTQ